MPPLPNPATPGPATERRNARLLVVAAIALVAVHVWLVLRNLPLPLLFDGVPLATRDFHYLTSTAFEAFEVLAPPGQMWGYSPYFMAGYPFGLWGSFGRRGYELAPFLLPMLDVPAAVHVYLLLTTLLPPFLIALAAQVLGLSRRRVLLSLCVAILTWHLSSLVSYFWWFGIVAFASTSALAVLFVALLQRGLAGGRWPLLAAAGICLGTIGWLHQLLVFPVALGTVLTAWFVRREVGLGRLLLRLLPVGALALAILLPWALPLWRFAGERDSPPTPFLAAGWKDLLMDLLSDRGYRRPHDRQTWFHLELVLLVVGMLAARRPGARAVLPVAVTALGSVLFAYGFAALPVLAETEPYRFLVTFSMFAVLPVGLGLERLLALYRAANAAGRVACACLALVLLPSLTGYLIDMRFREPAGGLDDEQQAVVGWLETNGRHGGRVLCQDPRLANLLPLYTRREVIGGGVSSLGSTPHRFTSADPEQCFGRPWRATTPERLAAYLDLYNVGVVVSTSEDLTALVAMSSGWRMARPGEASILVRDSGPPGWVHGQPESRTHVVWSRDRLRIEAAPKGRFVLRYHYLANMQAPAGVQLVPQHLLDDPVPFLGIENPDGHDTIEIGLSGG